MRERRRIATLLLTLWHNLESNGRNRKISTAFPLKLTSVAIVGGGLSGSSTISTICTKLLLPIITLLAGVACAHYLLPFVQNITIFDPFAPGSGGGTAASAGLVRLMRFVCYQETTTAISLLCFYFNSSFIHSLHGAI